MTAFAPFLGSELQLCLLYIVYSVKGGGDTIKRVFNWLSLMLLVPLLKKSIVLLDWGIFCKLI